MESSTLSASPHSATRALVDRLRDFERQREELGERERRPIRVLALDGGGIRGLVPARVLQAIEERTGQPIAASFDLIAGTSTGGILALGLTVPDPETGRPRWSAADLADMYRRRGGAIFHHPAWRVLVEWLVEKYAARGLEGVLRDRLGDANVRDALTEVLVTSWDLSADTPRYFSSLDAEDVPMRVAARATSAAPTYFRPLWLDKPSRRALVDGGVFANNPARIAWMAKRNPLHPKRPMVLVSLGTGAAKSPDPSTRRFWGPLPWARPMIDLLLTAPSDIVHLELEEVAAATALEYYRLDPDIAGASPRMDDVKPGNLAALDRAADALIEQRAKDLDAIAASVSGPSGGGSAPARPTGGT
jgi:uncharacterized protein